MATLFQILIIFAIIFFFIAGIIFGLMYIFWKTKPVEIPEDATFLINLMSKFSEGHAFGLELKNKLGKTGRRNVTEMIPLFTKDRSLDPINFPYHEFMRIDLPRGVLDINCNSAFLLSYDPNDLPKSIRDHPILGTAFTKIITMEKANNGIIEALRMGRAVEVETIRKNLMNSQTQSLAKAIELMIKNAQNQTSKV